MPLHRLAGEVLIDRAIDGRLRRITAARHEQKRVARVDEDMVGVGRRARHHPLKQVAARETTVEKVHDAFAAFERAAMADKDEEQLGPLPPLPGLFDVLE